MHSAFTPVLHLFVINYNHERNTQVWHVLSRDHTVLLGTIHIKANNDRLLLVASHTTAVPTPQRYSCSNTTAVTAVPTPQLLQLFPHHSCYSCSNTTAVPTPQLLQLFPHHSCSRTKAATAVSTSQLFPHHSCSHTTLFPHQSCSHIKAVTAVSTPQLLQLFPHHTTYSPTMKGRQLSWSVQLLHSAKHCIY